MSKLSEEDQKILQLIHSGSPPNDLLAFEIIKNRPYSDAFFGALINVCITTLNQEHAKAIFNYLKPRLSEIQQKIILREMEAKPRGIGALLATANKSINYKHFSFYGLGQSFSKTICTEIALTSFLKTGGNFMEFLALDDGKHPERQNVFQHFLKNQTSHLYRIIIPGLLAKEMDSYLTPFIQTSSPQPFTRNLLINDMKANEVSTILFKAPCPKLVIKHQFTEPVFPEYIFQMTGIKKLTLTIDKNTVLPKDWNKLSELTDLTIEGSGHVFHDFDFIDSLAKITTLSILNHKIASPSVLLRKKKVPIKGYFSFASHEGYENEQGESIIQLPNDKILSLASALSKSILSFEEQESYLKKILIHTQIKDLDLLPVKDLIALSNVNHPALRSALQTQLNEYSEKQKGNKSFNKNSVLYITGTPGRKKTEIKQKLKELGMAWVDDPAKGFTHLVVGKNPKNYKSLQNHSFQILSEQALYQSFKADAPGYLEEAVDSGDTQINDNILQFLYNDEGANVLVGLEMLKNGGVPDDLIDPLLVVYKCCPDAKARKLAKQLLERHAPASYIPLINDSQRFTNLNNKVRAQEINKKLEKIARGSSSNLAAHLSLLFHKRYKKGLRYILYHFKKPCDERSLALQAMMEGTHFDFASGLGFRNWKDEDPSAAIFYNMTSPAKFPVDIVDHVPLIESANFHNCKFTSLPQGIGKLKDLKKLDLSYNFLGSIPKSIENLTKLEHLDLQMNQFKTFPSTLKRLTNLKVLDLRFNRNDDGFAPVEITEDVKEALKGCEILL